MSEPVTGGPPLEELFSAAYGDLRRLASLVKSDDPGATLSPTTLVNEAFLKLAAAPRFKVFSPLHFRRIVARAMKDYARAEALYRGAIQMYSETQGTDHLNTGIARLKLGRTLLRQRRYADAAPEILAGQAIVSKQATPSVSFLRAAREDLVTLYEATNRPEQAAKYRAAP